MRKIVFVLLLMMVISIFLGCTEKQYEFKKDVDQIEKIEIVSAQSSTEFVVIKTLSDVECNDFIEQFSEIKFSDYFLGDPLSVSGTAVKITYKAGDYEMICHSWAEYVKNGEVYFVRKSCDEEKFNDLISLYT